MNFNFKIIFKTQLGKLKLMNMNGFMNPFKKFKNNKPS